LELMVFRTNLTAFMATRFNSAPRNKDPYPMCFRQKRSIEEKFDCFVCRIISHGKLRCYGAIRPDEDSPCYKVQIDYVPGRDPTVEVLSPKIIMNSKTHVYRDGHLCLYFPRDGRWKESDLISEKLIPWTSEWLVYYELFLISGEWEGPEAPHELP